MDLTPLAALLAIAPTPGATAQEILPAPGEALEVAQVWSGHPVGFCLWTEGEQQLVGFYDAERRMTIAQRRIDDATWTARVLPSRLGWDSHNAVTMAIDRGGLLHVVGNLHAGPLVYFRSAAPLDVTALRRVDAMVGTRERRMTYPVFFRGPDGALVFRYRDGGSGDGDDVMNVWDEDARTWRRLVDRPLIAGEGRVNGYFSTPTRGPDGLYHIVGIWRDTPDCATNHDVSYARSADLRNWERADGTSIDLPMTPSTIDIVDPVPSGGGAINGNVQLGFDRAMRPVVSYHKYDEDGSTRIHCARFEGEGWVVRPLGSFGSYRWEFGGGGSIPFEVRVGALRGIDDGHLALDYAYPGGSGAWRLDAVTLEVLGDAPRRPSPVPAAWGRVESDFEGMQLRTARDSGPGRDDAAFALVWETLGPHRDRPLDGPLPGPSPLRLVRTR
jgi:hypothetical protein